MIEYGSLFTSSFDAAKRARYGAHYTSRDDILLIIEPVLIEPLRREWVAAQAAIKADPSCADTEIRTMLERLRTIKVLDPAAGVGSFLYVAFQELKKLEREVVVFAIGVGWHP